MHLFFLDRYEKTVRATVLFTPLLQPIKFWFTESFSYTSKL